MDMAVKKKLKKKKKKKFSLFFSVNEKVLKFSKNRKIWVS